MTALLQKAKTTVEREKKLDEEGAMNTRMRFAAAGEDNEFRASFGGPAKSQPAGKKHKTGPSGIRLYVQTGQNSAPELVFESLNPDPADVPDAEGLTPDDINRLMDKGLNEAQLEEVQTAVQNNVMTLENVRELTERFDSADAILGEVRAAAPPAGPAV